MDKDSNDPTRQIILSGVAKKMVTLIAGNQSLSKENKHISAVHNKEKPYECEVCLKAFGQKGTLNQHISAVHKQEKLHVCHECNKPFSRKSSLKRHIRTVHNQEKPYECEVCLTAFGLNTAFGLKSSLKRHISTLHNFPCATCPKIFFTEREKNFHSIVCEFNVVD